MQSRFFGLENICLQLETEAKGDLEIALDNGLLITLWGCTYLYSPYKGVPSGGSKGSYRARIDLEMAYDNGSLVALWDRTYLYSPYKAEPSGSSKGSYRARIAYLRHLIMF